FRVFYVANRGDAVFALHCFQKKTQKTAKKDGSTWASSATRSCPEPGHHRATCQIMAIEYYEQRVGRHRGHSRGGAEHAPALRAHGEDRRPCPEWSITQKEAARRLGITQPRLNDLLSGRINKFSLDALVNLTGPARFHLELEIEDEEEVAAYSHQRPSRACWRAVGVCKKTTIPLLRDGP
ncbi:MAG: XRE family transcriptional regulator, partial [Halomonas sp.]|uniref:helix-turn-helix domain-containing protein n=1 Tax=Halomonas sp. TaxID=1486246 RepID=UPI002ACD2F3D